MNITEKNTIPLDLAIICVDTKEKTAEAIVHPMSCTQRIEKAANQTIGATFLKWKNLRDEDRVIELMGFIFWQIEKGQLDAKSGIAALLRVERVKDAILCESDYIERY